MSSTAVFAAKRERGTPDKPRPSATHRRLAVGIAGMRLDFRLRFRNQDRMRGICMKVRQRKAAMVGSIGPLMMCLGLSIVAQFFCVAQASADTRDIEAAEAKDNKTVGRAVGYSVVLDGH